MTTPRFASCRCAHPKADHEQPGLAPQCSARACTCLSYRPISAAGAAAPTPVAPAARPAQHPQPAPTPTSPPARDNPEVETLLARGHASTSKRITALTAKIEELLKDLEQRLVEAQHAAEQAAADEKRRADARARVAKLQRELDQAKAALRPARKTTSSARPGPRPSATPGDGVCPECGRTGLTNIGAHRSRAHGYRAGAA